MGWGDCCERKEKGKDPMKEIKRGERERNPK